MRVVDVIYTACDLIVVNSSDFSTEICFSKIMTTY